MGPEHEAGPVGSKGLVKACPVGVKTRSSWDPTVCLPPCVTKDRSLLTSLSQAFPSYEKQPRELLPVRVLGRFSEVINFKMSLGGEPHERLATGSKSWI